MVKPPLFDTDIENTGYETLDGKYRHQWVEESINVEPSLDSNDSTGPTRSYLGSSISNSRLIWALWIMCFGLLIILGRMFYLQIWRGIEFRDLAEGNRIRLKPIPAERGIIYDRFGRELVINVPSFSLTVTQRDLPRADIERSEVIAKTAEISNLPYTDIVSILNKYRNFTYESITVKENLDHETAIKLYVQNPNLSGVAIESGTKRFYPHNFSTTTTYDLLSLSHVLGYTGKLNAEELQSYKNDDYLPSDDIGKSGIEKFYEKDLRGKYGKKKIEVNALGREQSVLAEEPPVPGKNLFLTIDAAAQAELETIIKKQLTTKGFERAAAIAMDPNSGAILAMVSWPSFDSNDFSGGIDSTKYKNYLNDSNRPLFMRAIAGNYPSGSIVKSVVAAAALQEGIATPATTVLSTGAIQVGKWTFKDWKSGGHGVTNITKALAWSVNTFFYYIGGGYNNFTGLGIERLLKYFRIFNLGQTTGIDLPGENSGFLPTREWKEKNTGEKWYVGDTYNISIGQGHLLVTPLQAAIWTSAVANGGQIVWPHIADYFIDTNHNTKTSINFPVKNKNIVSAQTISVVQQGMRECVTSGSCQLLNRLPFLAAGKTGTAQWNSNKNPHAWFVGFAPYNNPKIVVVVLVEEGKEGSTAAMPIANEFLKWWGTNYLK